MPMNFVSAPLRYAAACILLLLVAPLHAQYDNGSVVGTVRDATGASLAGAAVTITNVDTAISTTMKTNNSGDYEAPSERAGVYTIKASSPGFSDAVAENITVSVGGRQRIDLILKVGSTATSVQISGVALQVETETSERGQTLTNYQSESLPQVNRNYSDFLALIPGSRQAPTAGTTTSINSLVRAGSYNVNGERSMFNNFLLDGIDNNAYGESNQGFDNQIVAIPPDSVAQLQVVTNNESAEYGRASGATINVASRGGTNHLHSTVYEFIRNTDLNASGFFKPTVVGGTGITTPFVKPTFNRNQYGFNVGGPILKDKLFFFLDYEGFRQVLKPLTVLTLPTQNELNGILVQPVRNPLTGVIYPAGTAIPTSAINPLSLQIISYFNQIPGLPVSGIDTASTPNGVTGLASNDYSKQVPFTDNADKGDLRLDYQIDANSSAFLRISDRKEDGLNFPSIPVPLDGQTNGKIRILDQQIVLGFTHLFGASKVLDTRIGLDRTKAGKYNLSIGNTAFNSIPGLPTANAVVAGGLPSLGITNFSGFGRQSTNPQWQDPALIDPKVNFTWVKGNHSLKFGYEFEHIWMAVNDNNPLYGSWTYAGGYSLCTAATSATCALNINGGAAATSPVADTYWADFLFGTTNNYSLANFYEAHLTQTDQSLYAQDDWKVDSNLTLNLGLRWEYGSPYSELHNNISNFDPISQTVLTLSPGAVAGSGITPYSGGGTYGHTLVNPDYRDFGPRLGFAYAIDPNTAIRGGFGMSYSHYTRAGSGDILGINAPQAQFASVTQIAPNTTNHCPTPLPAHIIATGTTTPSCYATADQGYPSGLVTSFNSATDNITYIPKNNKASYVESYFLDVQRTLAKNMLLDIAYIGNHGLKLEGFLNANQRNPALGYANPAVPSQGFARPYANWPSDITEALNEFYSHYDSLQVKYEQRFVGGLTLLNSFTWEHSLDNASASLEGNTPSPQDGNNTRADYSQSDYNLPIANITSLVYELPFGRGRQFLSGANSVVDSVLGGWQISGINSAQAGTPFNVTYNPNSAQALSPQIAATYRGANEYRPDYVSGQPVTQGVTHRAANTGYVNYINPNAFVLPPIKDAAGNYLSPIGNATRNPGRGQAFYQTDLSLNKKFSTPIESLKVEFRTEFYNIFNHTNFTIPGAISATQGTTSLVAGAGNSIPVSAIAAAPSTNGQITSTLTPRVLQFGLKIIF